MSIKKKLYEIVNTDNPVAGALSRAGVFICVLGIVTLIAEILNIWKWGLSMEITLVTQRIDRQYCPSNSSINNRIKSITKNVVGVHKTHNPLQVGEVIKFNGSNYQVCLLMREVENDTEIFTALVCSYNNEKFNNSRETYESIPLVIDME